MGILKKLLCKKVRSDDDDYNDYENDDNGLVKPLDDTSSDDSSGSSEGASPRSRASAKQTSSRREEYEGDGIEYADDVYKELQQEIEDMDIPPEWVIDYRIMGVHKKGAAITTSSRSIADHTPCTASHDQHIVVEEVRKSLNQKKNKKQQQSKERKKNSLLKAWTGSLLGEKNDDSSTHGRSSLFCHLLREQQQQQAKKEKALLVRKNAEAEDELVHRPSLDQVAHRMLENLRMAEHHGHQQEVMLKPKSILRKSSNNTTNNKGGDRQKAIRFDMDLVQVHYLLPTVLPRSPDDVIQSPAHDREHNSSTNQSITSDELSVDEQSVETMELLWHHLACSPPDRSLDSDYYLI